MSQIQKIEQFRKELALAETYEDIKALDAKASAIAEFARRNRVSKQKQDELGEFRIEIEAKKGAWLDEFFPKGGDFVSKKANLNTSSLVDVGITYNESANARLISKEQEIVRDVVEQLKKDDKQVVTPYAVQKEIRKIKKAENLKSKKQSFNKEITLNKSVAKCFNGSCIDYLQEFDNQIDLVLTDPPYAMDYKSGWNDWDKIEGDKRDDTLLLLDECFSLLKQRMKDNAHIYVFGNPNEMQSIKPLFEKYFKLKNILIWDRQVIGMGDLKTYGRSYDVVYFGYNNEWKDLNGTRDRDVLNFSRVSPGNLIHPTEKPTDMLQYLIKKSSNENDVVFDPFAGSCSTLKASLELNRNSYGSELETKYIPKWML